LLCRCSFEPILYKEFTATMDEPHTARQGEDAASDWHPADILAALKKRGQTLSGLSVANGYHPTAAGKALKRPWPAMEGIIAGAIGVSAGTLWPSRYAGTRSPHNPELKIS
jgi:Ner family transcriptional regulator